MPDSQSGDQGFESPTGYKGKAAREVESSCAAFSFLNLTFSLSVSLAVLPHLLKSLFERLLTMDPTQF